MSINGDRKSSAEALTLPEALVILLFVVLGLIVRAWALWQRGVVDFDQTYYYILGRNLLSGGGYTLNGLPHTAFGPLYPLFTGIAGLVTSGIHAATSSVTAVMGTLVVVPVWLLARDIYGRRAGLLAAGAGAVWPALFFFSARAMGAGAKMYGGSEPTYATLVISGILCLWLFARRGGTWRAGAGGFFLGAASLVRSEGPLLFAFLLAWVILDGLFTKRLFERRHIAGLLAAVLVMAAVHVPFLVHVRRWSGSWSLGAKLESNIRIRQAMWDWAVNGRPQAFVRINYALDESGTQMADPYWGLTRDHLVQAGEQGVPAGSLALVLTAEKRWLPVWLGRLVGGRLSIVPWYLAAVIGLGVLTGPRESVVLRWWCLVAAVLFSSLLVAVSLFVFARHLVVLAPLLAVAAGRGLVSLQEGAAALSKRLMPRCASCCDAAGAAAAGVVLVAMLLHGVEINLAGNRPANVDNGLSNQAAERVLAERLGEVLPAGSTFMCLKPWVALWGGFEWRVVPIAPPGRIVTYAAANGIDYALLEDRLLDASGRLGELSSYHIGTFHYNENYHLFDLRKARAGH